jgi:hypothetical protein
MAGPDTIMKQEKEQPAGGWNRPLTPLPTTTYTPHEDLHWSFCYDDYCSVHLQSKQNNNYFPTAGSAGPTHQRRNELTELASNGEKKKNPPCIPNNKDEKHLLFHRHLIRSTCLHIRTIFRSVPSRFRGLLSRKVPSGLLRPVSEPIRQHHTTQRVTAIPETTASLLRQPNPATNQSLSSPASLLCRAIC